MNYKVYLTFTSIHDSTSTVDGCMSSVTLSLDQAKEVRDSILDALPDATSLVLESGGDLVYFGKDQIRNSYIRVRLVEQL